MFKKNYVKVLCISLVMVFVGSFYANTVQTSNGKVVVRDISFLTEDGITLHGLLYVPNSATNKNPAPTIVSSHGYNNTVEVQAINSVELSRRGYVVFSIDAYWHGLSGGTSLNVDNNNVVGDMGGYAALQYVATLPFVDKDNIGMVGHSMGCAVIQGAALRAFTNNETDPSIAIPKALLLTSNAFSVDKDNKLTYGKYPVNLGDVFGQYDEWSENMWGPDTKKGSDYNKAPKAIAAMGFSEAEYNTYYNAGDTTPLTKEEAVIASNNKTLRVLYSPPIDHPQVHFSDVAVKMVTEYFNITLNNGTEVLPANDLVWFSKELATLVAMIGFLLFIVPISYVLLEIPYFKAIIQKEPQAPTIITDAKSKRTYWLIYFLCLIPAPLLFFWAVGYPIDIAAIARKVPIVLVANNYFVLPAINGIVIINVIVGLFLLCVFTLTYNILMKKNCVKFSNLGIKIPFKHIVRVAILSAIIFFSTYMLLVLANYFFMSDFRFFVFSFKTLSAVKWPILLKYLPFFLFFTMISSLTMNSFTRIRGKSELVNMLYIICSSCLGYIVLFIIDYSGYIFRGYKTIMYVPGFGGANTSALAGMFVWNMIFILPIAAVISRLLFKRTGSIWLGGFVNSLLLTLFAVSNTVIAAGVLL